MQLLKVARFFRQVRQCLTLHHFTRNWERKQNDCELICRIGTRLAECDIMLLCMPRQTWIVSSALPLAKRIDTTRKLGGDVIQIIQLHTSSASVAIGWGGIRGRKREREREGRETDAKLCIMCAQMSVKEAYVCIYKQHKNLMPAGRQQSWHRRAASLARAIKHFIRLEVNCLILLGRVWPGARDGPHYSSSLLNSHQWVTTSSLFLVTLVPLGAPYLRHRSPSTVESKVNVKLHPHRHTQRHAFPSQRQTLLLTAREVAISISPDSDAFQSQVEPKSFQICGAIACPNNLLHTIRTVSLNDSPAFREWNVILTRGSKTREAVVVVF